MVALLHIRCSLHAAARDTVTVEIAHADKETIGTACGKGFPKPKQTFGELGTGEAYVGRALRRRPGS